MAILGGAGNVAGSNPAGVGSSINYVTAAGRTFAYAYSGSVIVNNTTVTALSFNSGSNTINAEVQLQGIIADMGSSKKIGLIVSFDNQKISENIRLTNAAQSFMDMDPLYIIIPPYTDVKIEIITDNAADIRYYATLTGEVFY